MGFQITSPSGIYKRQPLFFLFNVAANWMLLPIRKAALPVLNIKALQQVREKASNGSYRCLSTPRPDGSRSRRALYRTRRHRGTLFQGWWAPQSRPAPRRWGTPSISSERRRKAVRGKLNTSAQQWNMNDTDYNKNNGVFMDESLPSLLLQSLLCWHYISLLTSPDCELELALDSCLCLPNFCLLWLVSDIALNT